MRCLAKTFEDLVVWQGAHQFVLAVTRLSRTFPQSETYGLSSQFRRTAVSIAANIAEGFRKRWKTDKIRFLNIVRGSLEESRGHLILARDLDYRDVSASMAALSTNVLGPTTTGLSVMFLAWAPPVKRTWRPEPAVRVEAIWKTQTSFGPPCSVRSSSVMSYEPGAD
jgi:four helix bundle protein